ncbi:ingression protein fic1 [Rhypophila decipiens]
MATTKTKTHPLNGMHTAGIFSDMTVDGPQIGTLVVIVDRAKNLPNRKTIGKQDPYCAARLGKEAKKTNTDIRGGQTPKWDQELRFIVHDSPDYYQLKVSVFNDDKKTDLIGEAWIDLRDIIVSGGGQSDQWHQLACRGKYAGEVRIEITFYDSRPKPEKPVVKAKQQPSSTDLEGAASSSSSGATGPRAMPKRRPLPSDPVTGKAPVSPSPGPEPVEPAARPQQPSFVPTQSPLQQLEYNTPIPGAAPVSRQHQQQESYGPQDQTGGYSTPSRRNDIPVQQYRTPERADRYSGHPDERSYSLPNYQQQPDRYDARPQERFNSPQFDDRGLPPDDERPPPPPAHRSRTGSNNAMNTSYQNFDVAAKGNPPTMRQDVLRSAAHRTSASTSYPGRPTYKAYDSAPAAPISSQHPNQDHTTPPRHYSYDTSYDQPHRNMQATVEDVPESPDSQNASFRRSGSRMPQNELDYDFASSPAPLSVGNRGSVVPSGRFGNVGNGSEQHSRHGSNGYDTSPTTLEHHSRHNSGGYMASPTSLGPAEVPSQPAPRNYARHSETSLVAYGSQGDDRALAYRSELDDTSNGYAPPPVPASLVPGMDPSIAQEISQRFHEDKHHHRRYTQPAAIEAPHRGRATSEQPYGYEQDNSPAPYHAPPPPQSRSPVVYTGGAGSSVNVVIKPRGHSPNPIRDPSPNPRHTIRRKSVSPAPPPSESRRLSGVPFSPDSYDTLNPKVASSASLDSAALRSDYDETSGKIITHDGREVDPSDHLPVETWAPEPEPRNKQFTTGTYGSDRPSASVMQPAALSGRRPLRIAGRPQPTLPSNTQYALPDMSEPVTPAAPAGRNRLQKKAHRTSTAALPTGPVMSGANGPALDHHDYGSRRGSDVGSGSPLAPLPAHQDNFTPPRQLPRASTFDSNYYSNGSENHAPSPVGNGGYYGGSPSAGYSPGGGGARGGRGVPPVPAKVPLALPPPPGPAMSGALQLHSSSLARRGVDEGGYDSYGNNGGGGDMWGAGELSLEEELQRIDIGTGRSRRHGYGQGHGGSGHHGY